MYWNAARPLHYFLQYSQVLILLSSLLCICVGCPTRIHLLFAAHLACCLRCLCQILNLVFFLARVILTLFSVELLVCIYLELIVGDTVLEKVRLGPLVYILKGIECALRILV